MTYSLGLPPYLFGVPRERRYERPTLVGSLGGQSYPECVRCLGKGSGEESMGCTLAQIKRESISKPDLARFPCVPASSIAAPQTSLRRGEGKARWSRPRPRRGDNSRVPPKGGSAFGQYCSRSLTRSGEGRTRKTPVRGWVSSGALCLPAAPVSCPPPLDLGARCGQDEQSCAGLWAAFPLAPPVGSSGGAGEEVWRGLLRKSVWCQLGPAA